MDANARRTASGMLADSRLVRVWVGDTRSDAGSEGSGWAVGDRGVLTAQHVVQKFVEGEADRCVVVPGSSPGSAGFDACEWLPGEVAAR